MVQLIIGRDLASVHCEYGILKLSDRLWADLLALIFSCADGILRAKHAGTLYYIIVFFFQRQAWSAGRVPARLHGKIVTLKKSSVRRLTTSASKSTGKLANTSCTTRTVLPSSNARKKKTPSVKRARGLSSFVISRAVMTKTIATPVHPSVSVVAYCWHAS